MLTVDLRVMDISDFGVTLGMDWLMAHRVIIDYDHKRITAYKQDSICVTFFGDISMMLYPKPCTTPGGMDS